MEAVNESFLSTGQRTFWRLLQGVFFAIGVVILAALFLKPALGLHLLWNVLIPVAPALLVLAPGVWRNVSRSWALGASPWMSSGNSTRPATRSATAFMLA